MPAPNPFSVAQLEPADVVRLAYHFARRRAPAHLRADAAQSFVVGSLKAAARARPGGFPRHYIVTGGLLAMGNALHVERRQRPLGTCSLDATPPGAEDGGTLAETVVDYRFEAPDERALDASVAEAVREAVAGLPRREREAVEAVYLDGGATLAEAGRRLGITGQAVSQRVGRGLDRLRHRLSHLKPQLDGETRIPTRQHHRAPAQAT